MAVQMTKSQLIEKISAETEVAKKDVKGVLETLASVGYKELKKSGVFLVPGFAKFVVIKKPATKARKGTNPFTGEPMTFKAKPARKIVRARPVKAAKDAVESQKTPSGVFCVPSHGVTTGVIRRCLVACGALQLGCRSVSRSADCRASLPSRPTRVVWPAGSARYKIGSVQHQPPRLPRRLGHRRRALSGPIRNAIIDGEAA